jgi:hypothetical protein
METSLLTADGSICTGPSIRVSSWLCAEAQLWNVGWLYEAEGLGWNKWMEWRSL